MSWESFEQDLKQSSCAGLYSGSNLVIGRGGKSPRVVFVGEAPGAKEDELGLPFVGRSGTLLDSWIEYLGLSEDEYYITNVVKCRPPENRDPTKDEVALCEPFLHRQLELLNPEYVVCVGRFAMKVFFPKKKSILKESGRLLGKYYIVPHPSYFLRRGGTGWEEYLNVLRIALHSSSQEKLL